MSHTVHAFQAAFDLHFAVDRLNQSLDVSITERIGLETTRIIRVTGHVIRTNRARELRVRKIRITFEKFTSPSSGKTS
jgi:hypothetical protein